MNRRLAAEAFGLFVAFAALPALADSPPPPMLTPAEIKWGDVPPAFPKGAKLAVLYGDPAKTGELFIVRLKMPANYKLPAHWHPTDENITVISGTFLMGMGDKLDAKKAKPYPAGSFMETPAKTNHYALAKGETIVEVSAMGPFAITYVNPDDDPSKVPAAKK
jgi:hypothetical protein